MVSVDDTMTTNEVSNALATFLLDLGYETRSYSGRGMSGKTCLACLVPRVDALTLLVKVGAHMEGSGYDVSSLGNTYMDTLGLYDNVLYWPYLPYVKTEIEEEEEEEENE